MPRVEGAGDRDEPANDVAVRACVGEGQFAALAEDTRAGEVYLLSHRVEPFASIGSAFLIFLLRIYTKHHRVILACTVSVVALPHFGHLAAARMGTGAQTVTSLARWTCFVPLLVFFDVEA